LEDVITRTAIDQILTTTACDGVIAKTAVEDVVGCGADDGVITTKGKGSLRREGIGEVSANGNTQRALDAALVVVAPLEGCQRWSDPLCIGELGQQGRVIADDRAPVHTTCDLASFCLAEVVVVPLAKRLRLSP